MEEKPQIPTSLKVVAILFIIGGVFAAIEVLVSFVNGRININFGVLGLFIGPGLLALRPGWRTCGLVFIWIALIGMPIAAILMLAQPNSLRFGLFGLDVGHAPLVVGLAVAAGTFALAFWQYRVLTRPDVRRLFGLPFPRSG